MVSMRECVAVRGLVESDGFPARWGSAVRGAGSGRAALDPGGLRPPQESLPGPLGGVLRWFVQERRFVVAQAMGRPLHASGTRSYSELAGRSREAAMAIRFHCPRQDCRSNQCPAKKIYSCLSPKQDASLGRERLARRYESGQVVIHHDTPALAIFSVHSGLVRLTRAASSGREVVVGLRGPGELLGVREVLSALPYQATAETLEPSIVCAVPREAFLDAVRDCPELAMRLLGRLAKDGLLAEEQLVARVHLSVRARTARLLLALAEGSRVKARGSAAFEVTMAREEMALLVGTTRETLSRSLGQLAERGAIKLAAGKIRVLDSSVLEGLAD